MDPDSDAASDELSAKEQLAYETVAARRVQFDAAVWSVPALSIAAQSFILGIAVDQQVPPWLRIAVASLGLLTGVASAFLMTRHRVAELADAKWLADFEERRGMPLVHGQAWLRSQTEPLWRMPGWHRYVYRIRVYHLWQGLLGLFALVMLAIWAWNVSMAVFPL